MFNFYLPINSSILRVIFIENVSLDQIVNKKLTVWLSKRALQTSTLRARNLKMVFWDKFSNIF